MGGEGRGDLPPALVEIVVVIMMILMHMKGHNLLVVHMMHGHLLVDGHMHLLDDGHVLDHRHRYLLDMMMMHSVHLVGHMDCVVLAAGSEEKKRMESCMKVKFVGVAGRDTPHPLQARRSGLLLAVNVTLANKLNSWQRAQLVAVSLGHSLHLALTWQLLELAVVVVVGLMLGIRN